MHYTIYKTTNTVNNKIYIGKHKTANLDDSYMGSGKHLRSSIKKYGSDNFVKEILFIFDNESEMNAKEKELVSKEFCARKDTYNLTEGGRGGFGYINDNKLNYGDCHKKSSYENLDKGRRTRSEKIRNDPVYRQEQNDAISKRLKRYYETHDGSWTGKSHSEEAKKKIGAVTSLAQRGTGNSQYGSKWINDGITCFKIKATESVPEGHTLGRIKKIKTHKCEYCENSFQQKTKEKFCSSKCRSYSTSNNIKIIDDNLENMISYFMDCKSMDKTLKYFGVVGVRAGSAYFSEQLGRRNLKK